jgi:hypothetical protein
MNRIIIYDLSIDVWRPVGYSSIYTGSTTNNGVNNNIMCSMVLGTKLYVAGDFTRSYDTSGIHITNKIAIYDTTTSLWNALGYTNINDATGVNQGTNNTVNTIAIKEQTLYVGGAFTSVFDINGTHLNINRIARFNMSNSLWESIGLSNISLATTTNNGTNNTVKYIAIIEEKLYVSYLSTTVLYDKAGQHTNIRYIAIYNTTTSLWSTVWLNNINNATTTNNGTNGNVYTVVKVGDNIYIGGIFSLSYSYSGQFNSNSLCII